MKPNIKGPTSAFAHVVRANHKSSHLEEYHKQLIPPQTRVTSSHSHVLETPESSALCLPQARIIHASPRSRRQMVNQLHPIPLQRSL